MAQIIFIAIAAGAASTLLFASLASGSPFAVPLFNLAPLPILIAGMGWSHLAALLAAAIAAVLLGAFFSGLLLVNFLIGVGLPAWWLAYLVLLGRPTVNGTANGVEWYPIGRIVVWTALLASLIVTLVIFMVASDTEDLRATLRRSLIAVLQLTSEVVDGTGGETSSRLFVQMLLDYPERVLPPAAAILTMLMQTFTVWLAARVVRVSGRLRRPWPEIAAMRFPPAALGLLAGALLASFLPGLLGIIASVVTSSLLTAYALLGLAVMHALTLGIGARGFILGSVYGGIAILGWPLLIMTLLGLIDTRLDLRARLRGPRPPTIPT